MRDQANLAETITPLKSEETLIPLGLGAAAVLFYTPFLLHGFICDDILWLANARIALEQPSQFLSRAMYGYFRPLNMVVISLLYKLFGLEPFLFSLFAKLIHGINVFLLYLLCRRLKLSVPLSVTAAFIFGFYVVNSSAVFYISTVHDLMMVTLLLVFTLLLLRFLERWQPVHGIALLLVGLAVTLIKEVGFMSIGLYFVCPLLLTGRFPKSRNYYLVGGLFVLVLAAYLSYYFATRVQADRELSFGLSILKNLWYSTVFLFIPTTERITGSLSSSVIQLLRVAKIVFTIGLVPVFLYALLRAAPGVRLMTTWVFLILLPTSVFDWKFQLFSLYPERTLTRLMYVATPGMAVLVAWLFDRILLSKRSRLMWGAVAGIAVLFVAFNFAACRKVFGHYEFKSEFVNSLIAQLGTINDEYPAVTTVTIHTEDLERTEQEIWDSEITSSLYWLYYNERIDFHTLEDSTQAARFSPPDHLHLRWDPGSHALIYPKARDRDPPPPLRGGRLSGVREIRR